MEPQPIHFLLKKSQAGHSGTYMQMYLGIEPEPDRIVHGEPWIRQQPDPDPDVAGSRSGKTGSRPGYCRI